MLSLSAGERDQVENLGGPEGEMVEGQVAGRVERLINCLTYVLQGFGVSLKSVWRGNSRVGLKEEFREGFVVLRLMGCR